MPAKSRSRFSLLILFSLILSLSASYTFAAPATKTTSEEITIQDNIPQSESNNQFNNPPNQVNFTINGSFFNLTQQQQLSDIQQLAVSPLELHATLWRYIKRYNQLLAQSNHNQLKLTDGVKTSPLNTKNAQVAFLLPKFEKSYLVLNYQAQTLTLNNVILILPLNPDKKPPPPQQLEIYQTISQTAIMALSRGIAKESVEVISKDLWNNQAIYQPFNGKYRWLNTSCSYNSTLQNRVCIFYKKN